MNQLSKIFEVLARDSSFWLPDFSQHLNPLDKDNNFIEDTETGYKYYCKWLTEYLSNNTLPIANHQLPIIKRLKIRKEISNAYILGNAGFSLEYLCENGLEKYPEDFLENPNPNRISNKDLKNFKNYFGIPKFRGLDANENLQASLVFEYVAIKQNKLSEKIKGPRWADIGWRCILKEGLRTIESKYEKINFVKNFIDEMVYLQSK